MAEATVAANGRFLTVLGPIKMEAISLSSCSDTNTVTTRMQRPLFAIATVTSDLAANQDIALNPAISGKTITINQASLSAKAVTLIVFGF